MTTNTTDSTVVATTTTTEETVVMNPVRTALESIFGQMSDEVWARVEEAIKSKPQRKTISSVVAADLEDFRALCLDPSLSYNDIGELYNCTGAMIRTLAEKHDCLVPRRRGRKPGTSTSGPAIEETTEATPVPTVETEVVEVVTA